MPTETLCQELGSPAVSQDRAHARPPLGHLSPPCRLPAWNGLGTNEVAAVGARIPVRGDCIARGRGRQVGRVGAEGSGESGREGTRSGGEAGAAEAGAEGGEERAGSRTGAAGWPGVEVRRRRGGGAGAAPGAGGRALSGGGSRAGGGRRARGAGWAQRLQQPGRQRRPRPRSRCARLSVLRAGSGSAASGRPPPARPLGGPGSGAGGRAAL